MHAFWHELKKIFNCRKNLAATNKKKIHLATVVENMNDLLGKMDYIMMKKYDKSSLIGLNEIEETKIKFK